MDILIHYTSLLLTLMLGILVFNGLTEIFYGLKHYFRIENIKITKEAFKYSSLNFNKYPNLQKLNLRFVRIKL